MALVDFTMSNARRFYSSMGNPSDTEGLNATLVYNERNLKKLRFEIQRVDTYQDTAQEGRKVGSRIVTFLGATLKAIPIKCFVSHLPAPCGGGSAGRATKKNTRKKQEWTLEGIWVPEKAGLLNKKAWLLTLSVPRGSPLTSKIVWR